MYKVSLIILLCLSCCGLSAKTATVVKTELKSGEVNSFTLSETGDVSFENRNLLIRRDNTDKITLIPLDDLKKLYFSNIEVSGVAQVSDEKIKVYPNPVADVLNVEVDGTADVLIISSDGRVVMSQNVSQKRDINVSGLAAGTYYVKIGGSTFKIEKL